MITITQNLRTLKKTGLLLVVVTVFALCFANPALAAEDAPQGEDPAAAEGAESLAEDSEWYTQNDILYYSKTGACEVSTVAGSGGAKLDGYSLPAYEGKTGYEEEVYENGQIPSGGTVTFSNHAKLGEEYRKFYITMRWNYVKWNWNGTSVEAENGGAHYRWLREKPRLVLVTNTKNTPTKSDDRSIIAVVMEAGPAPWTGVDTFPNNIAKEGWSNPQLGTPKGYTGRVSGFPPDAIKALDAKQGMSTGEGDVLLYSWAPDQNAEPGPVQISGQDSNELTSGVGVCGKGGSGFVNAQGYSMPISMPQKDISNGYRWPCRTGCHHDGTGAFDLAHTDTVKGGTDKDNLTAGVPVVAIHSGYVRNIRDTYNGIAGCGSFQFVEDPGDKNSWHYWYGHLSSKVDVKEGAKVTAGQPLGVVGPRKCTGNGSYPHLHIDRGSPKGHYGGSKGSRDRAFIKLMDSIYESTP